MHPETAFRYIGHGVYSLPEASRLISVPRQRIRRWLEGYVFRSSGRTYYSAPVVAADVGRSSGELSLSFADLLEVRFLDAFLQHGVSLREIRLAAEGARELVESDHPFSTKKFKTDGKSILAEIGKPRSRKYLDVAKSQWVFSSIVRPYLFAGVEFNQMNEPNRWWPLTKRKLVLIDPERSFGTPIVSEGGVPTRVLAASAKAEKSRRTAALLYDVPLRAVNHAVEYETQLSA